VEVEKVQNLAEKLKESRDAETVYYALADLIENAGRGEELELKTAVIEELHGRSIFVKVRAGGIEGGELFRPRVSAGSEEDVRSFLAEVFGWVQDFLKKVRPASPEAIRKAEREAEEAASVVEELFEEGKTPEP